MEQFYALSETTALRSDNLRQALPSRAQHSAGS